jgi:antitoxin YefM
VLISLEEYNSMIETMHLLGSMKNADRLYESMKEIRDQKGQTHDLIED